MFVARAIINIMFMYKKLSEANSDGTTVSRRCKKQAIAIFICQNPVLFLLKTPKKTPAASAAAVAGAVNVRPSINKGDGGGERASVYK